MHSLKSLRIVLALIAVLATPFHAVLAQVSPSLGTAGDFAVLGGSTVTNTGPTITTGSLGVNPGTAVTGFPPGTVAGGTTHAADAVALQAQNDTATAYGNLAGQACTTSYGVPTDIGGVTLVPGVYCFASSAQVTGTLTLNGGGDPNATWVFKTVSTLTTASNSSVVLINGAQNCNVFWQVGSSATIGTGTTFIGNVLALTSITLNTNATVSGRVLARNGAVTLDSNAVAVSSCALPPVTPIPPTLGKAFDPATIAAGGVSTLTITLSNPDATAASLTAPLTDTLPSGVLVAGTASTTCGGTVTVGASSVTLTGGSIPGHGSCTVTVPVSAVSGANYINSLAIGALQTSNGSNAVPAVATLSVPQPPLTPTLSKDFSPAIVTEGGASTLTITLSNASSTTASLTAPLTDTLPAGMVVAGVATTTCGGTVTGGTSTVTLTGGSILANGSCTVTVPVTAPCGAHTNSLAAGALQTSNGSNAGPAVASLTVNCAADVAPTLGKVFSPATINAGGTSTLTITLSNPGGPNAALTAPLIDNLPSGVTFASTPTTTCLGTVAVSGSTLTLTGSIPGYCFCIVTVEVTAPLGGSYVNTLAAGALQTSSGSNAGPAIATLTVLPSSPISLNKAFIPGTVEVNADSLLTIWLSNSSGINALVTGPLIDTMPAGLVIESGSTTCGGTLTVTPTSVTLTGGQVQASSFCKVNVLVSAAVPGSYFNSLPVGALQTNQGSNPAPAVATLTVVPISPPPVSPSLSKAFSPASITAGGTSTLTITLSNPNGTIAHLTAPLTDALPSGVVVSGNASTTCGGTLTAPTGASNVTLTGGSIPANAACTVRVDVTANPCGTYRNTLPIGALQTDQGASDTQAVATLDVSPAIVPPTPPTLRKDFSPATITAGRTSMLTITLSNPNDTAATLTGPLTDALLNGLVIAGHASTTCGGTLTAPRAGWKVMLRGGSIPANGSCVVTVDVTAAHQGSYCNKLPSGSLMTDKGSNRVAAAATLTVLPMSVPPTLKKAFSPATITAGHASRLIITLGNPNGTAANLTAPLTDAMPVGMVVSGNATTTCGGSLSAVQGSGTVVLNGGSIPANGSCTVTVDVAVSRKGTFCNKLLVGALRTDQGSNTVVASATLNVQRSSWW